VKQKLIFQLASPIFILLLPNNLLPINIQVDSTIKNIDVPIEIIDQNFFINHSYLFFPEISNTSFYRSPDSLISILNNDYFNQKPSSAYLFQSPLSEQWRINDQLVNYIEYRKGLTLNSELGVFGKLLYKARNLTALILAILHVLKHKKGLY
jgi:hypothetical protein